MLKCLGFFVKWLVISLIILVSGQFITWNRKTLSDHIKIQIQQGRWAQPFRSYSHWLGSLTHDAQLGMDRFFKKKDPSPPTNPTPPREWVTEEEKQSLRKLIQSP